MSRTVSEGATSEVGMDEIKDKFQTGRTKMIATFTVALGYVDDEDKRLELSGEFFDGNVEIKQAFGVMCLLAHVGLPEGWARWWESDSVELLARAAALHAPTAVQQPSQFRTWCASCSGPWPCATATALGFGSSSTAALSTSGEAEK